MDMVDNQIVSLAREVDPNVQPEDISPLEGGFNSRAYKVAADNPFVLLVSRESHSNTHYGHAFVVLKLLERHGYKHSPRALWLATDQSALALGFLEGVPADQYRFTDQDDAEQLAGDVMDALLDTATISLDEYKQLAAELHVEREGLILDSKQWLKESADPWFSLVKEHSADTEIVDWLESHLKNISELAAAIDTGEPTFSHGDPTNPNILLRPGGGFAFIDWDYARFLTMWPEYPISHTTRLTDFMKPYRSQLIQHVAERLNMDEAQLADRVLTFDRFGEVFDVLWAAWMMAKVSAGMEKGDAEEYHVLTHERMRDYDNKFK